MWAVFQLIATRLLDDLAHFNRIPPTVQEHSSVPLLSRRSPLLTNGHKLGGPYEQPWVDAMPIGDMFLSVMHRAWHVQSQQKRESLSPK
jgi:ubiquitin carboxyl-terminal hydrolase 16/45